MFFLSNLCVSSFLKLLFKLIIKVQRWNAFKSFILQVSNVFFFFLQLNLCTTSETKIHKESFNYSLLSCFNFNLTIIVNCLEYIYQIKFLVLLRDFPYCFCLLFLILLSIKIDYTVSITLKPASSRNTDNFWRSVSCNITDKQYCCLSILCSASLLMFLIGKFLLYIFVHLCARLVSKIILAFTLHS